MGIYPCKRKGYIPEEICMFIFPHGSFLSLFYLLWLFYSLKLKSYNPPYVEKYNASDCIAFNHAEIYLII